MNTKLTLVSGSLSGLMLAVASSLVAAQTPRERLPSGLREAVVEATYAVVPTEGSDWVAPNRAQGMHSRFTAEDGVLITSGDPASQWSLSLELESWGRPGARMPVEAVDPVAVGRRVEYRRGALTEWYLNDTRGLEQGFTIAEAPADPEGGAGLEIALSIGHGFAARVEPGGRDALLTHRATGHTLYYSGLRAWDSNQRELAASLVVEGERLSIRVDDRGAVYPVHVDPWFATEEAKLTNPQAILDHFGFSVALSGDTALVSSYGFDVTSSSSTEGAVFVYVHDGTTWTEQQMLAASDGQYADFFGFSVALSGDTALVGAPLKDLGHECDKVRGLALDPATKRLLTTEITSRKVAELDPATGVATYVGSLGFYQVEGLEFDPSSGTLYGADVQAGQLLTIDPLTGAPTPVGAIGFASVTGLALDPGTGTLYGADSATDDLIVIDTVTGAGSVAGKLGFANVTGLAFDPVTGTLYGCDSFTEQLITIDTATGAGAAVGPLGFNFMHGLTFDSATGTLYGVDSNIEALLTIDTSTGAGSVVGPFHITDSGAAYVFVRNGTSWSEEQKLIGSGFPLEFGSSVAVSDVLALVGAERTDLKGAAYVFARSGTTWSEQQKLTASDAANGDDFGDSVALSGGTAVVGAPLDDHAGGSQAGSAYVFVQSGTTWSVQQKLIASDAGQDDLFGVSVAVSGDTAVIGAQGYDLGGVVDAGTAYVFVQSGTSWSEQQKLTASDAADFDRLGVAVDVSGDTAVVIAESHDVVGPNQGAIYVFGRNGTTWSEQQELSASDGGKLSRSVALSGATVLAGASWVDAAYVFSLCHPPENYCTAGTSANGCQAVMSSTGIPSATAASGFVVTASGVEGQKQGILFWGPTPNSAPWGQGTSYICIAPPTTRTGTQVSGGTSGSCDGALTLDFNTWMAANPAKAPGLGSTVHVQAWFRDPPSPKNTSLSDGLRFVVCP